MATPYQCLNAWLDPAGVDDPRVPGLHGANLYGLQLSRGDRQHGYVEWQYHKNDLEYRLWRYQARISASHLRGMYFDNGFSDSRHEHRGRTRLRR